MQQILFYFHAYQRYIILILFALYTLEACILSGKPREKRKWGYVWQLLMMALFHFSVFLSLTLSKGDYVYLFYFAVQIVVLTGAMGLFAMLYPKGSRLLLHNMCMLLIVSFTILARLNFNRSIHQFTVAAVAIYVGLFLPWLMSRYGQIFKKYPWIYACMGILLLSLVAFLGTVSNGAKLSFTLLGVTFQPSELVKPLFVVFLAAAFAKAANLRQVCITASLAAVHVLLLAFSRDLGSALIFFMIYTFMVVLATGKWIYLLLGLAGGTGASFAAYELFRHVQVRVQAWKDPWSVIDGTGYQIAQSLFAISNGGFWGTGLNKGNPAAIPYVTTDFIFSAITEEFGLLFAVCLLILCVDNFLIMMKTALHQEAGFERYLAFGLGVSYLFQTFLTIGGGTKCIPLTGVTLPLVSYGGSSVLTTILSFFMVQGVLIGIGGHEKSKGRRLLLEKNVQQRILRVSYLSAFVFLGMMGYVTWYTQQNRQKFFDNSYNSRQQLLMQENTRGSIYAADGAILAETVTDKEGKETRDYPYGKLFAHAVGYSTKGKAGLEAAENYYLMQSSLSETEKLSNSQSGDKNPGDSVYTTLRVDLQQTAYDALGVYKGAVVVTEVSTGKVLAMVSKPDFDPNEIDRIWDKITEDENNSVLVNRVTNGKYPPGSTFKILTALEYIREYPQNLNRYEFQCTGSYTYDGNTINCYHHIKHGTVDFTTSFAKSCNSSFANIGMRLDREKFEKTLQKLYFNEKLPSQMAMGISTTGFSGKTGDYETMQTVIGQGSTLMTPMHLNMITAAIANKGVMMQPYLTDCVKRADGQTVKQNKPKVGEEQLISGEEAAELTRLMTQVVEKGTAIRLSGLSYTVAGKTGSAEYNDVKGESHAWFTGFAPVENPEIAVTIILEGAGSGGDHAVPIAKRILDCYFGIKQPL